MSNFVSLHLPLTRETRGYIGERELRRMKLTACLINTARGAIVDEPALYRALREGWIAGAGLDVFVREPPWGLPLLALDNVVMTIHIAGWTEETWNAMARQAATEAVRALQEQPPLHALVAQVVDKEGFVGMLERSMELKKRLRAGEITIGAVLSFSSPAVAEIMAGAGFDWLLIETEHSPFTLESLVCTLMAFNGRDTVPIVRVRWNDRAIIKQALDLGAEGILVPHVGSPEEAQQAVAACRYPPEGVRGFGPWRASNYYRHVDEYTQMANEGVIVAIQIEHIKAVKAAREILAVPGIDVVLLGPMDLSGSLGLLGQLDHPQVMEAIEHVIAEAGQAGIPVGVPGQDIPPDALAWWVSLGCQIVFAGEDHSFLRRMVDQTLMEFWQRLSADKKS